MSRVRLPIILGIVVLLAGVAAGLFVLRTRSAVTGDLPLPASLPKPAVPPVPPLAAIDRPVPPVPPSKSGSAAAPVAADAAADPLPAPAAPGALPPLFAELNAALPKLGVAPPAQLTAASVERSLLILTFNAEFRPHLSDLSALDELTAALSSRVLAHGYRNLELRVLDPHGQARSLAELTTTPPTRRPRPEPIDDGVRR